MHLLEQIAVFLLTAVLIVPIFQRLKLGAVLGYLAAGMIIGPWGLGVIGAVESTLEFSEFGVVLLLFLIGLELEPRRLWTLRNSVFGLGGAQVIATGIVVALLAMAAGFNWQAALIIGLGCAMSSTALVMSFLNERKQLLTRHGRESFAILLFQDLAVIPLLALLPLLAPVTGHSEGQWLGVAKGVIVIAVLIAGSRLVIRPLLKFIAHNRSQEVFTAAALLLVIGTALIMEKIGLSMSLGAFLAGVLLADSEFRHELEADIEPFKGLLLGLFFIAVGMSINFGVLIAQPLMMALLVVGFMVVKLVVIYALAKAMGIPYQQRPVFTLLLAQGGEFAFVVFQAAGPNVLPPEVTSLLIGAVALSMLLSPLLLVAIDKWVLPRYNEYAKNAGPKIDEISEQQEPKVLILGFGRYGQIIGRMLWSQGLPLTVLDHDSDTVEGLREFGFRVFYGDATRLDLLRTAGAATARVVVVAVDDIEQSLTIVDLLREHFPQARVVARARNLRHLYQLRDRGVEHIEREVFESSLRSARATLEGLGWPAYEARETAMRFRARNIKLMDATYPHYKDRAKVIAVAKEGRQQFEEQMTKEREERQKRSGVDWGKLESEEEQSLP